MTKKAKKNNDVVGVMVQIQEQLAQMNQKLDSFMTKSLTELADARAASKPVVIRQAPAQTFARPPQQNYPPRRTMYAVVCFECGKDTELPFKPSGNRPVYCRECFALKKSRPQPVNAHIPSSSNLSVQSTILTSTLAVKKKRKAATSKSAKAKKPVKKKRSPAKKKSSAKKKPASKKSKAKKKTAGKARGKKR